MAEAATLAATVTNRIADIEEAERLAFVAGPRTRYENVSWLRLRDGTVGVRMWTLDGMGDGWKPVVYRTTATPEQVLAARESGALVRIDPLVLITTAHALAPHEEQQTGPEEPEEGGG